MQEQAFRFPYKPGQTRAKSAPYKFYDTKQVSKGVMPLKTSKTRNSSGNPNKNTNVLLGSNERETSIYFVGEHDMMQCPYYRNWAAFSGGTRIPVRARKLSCAPRKYIFDASICLEKPCHRQLSLEHGFLPRECISNDACSRGTVLITRLPEKLGKQSCMNNSNFPINSSTNNISDGFEHYDRVTARSPNTMNELRKVSEQVIEQPGGSDVCGTFQIETPATLSITEGDEGRGHIINEVPDEGACQFFLPIVDEAKSRHTAKGGLFTFAADGDDRSLNPSSPSSKQLPSNEASKSANLTKIQHHPSPKKARTLIKRPEPVVDILRSVGHKGHPVREEVYCAATEWRAFLISQTSISTARRPAWNMGTKFSDSSKPKKRRHIESTRRKKPRKLCKWNKTYVHQLTDPVNRVASFQCTAPRRPDSIEVKLCSSTHLAQSVAATTRFALRSTVTSGALSGEIYSDRTVKSSASLAPGMEDSKVATLTRECNLEEAEWHQILLPPPSHRLHVECLPEIGIGDADEDVPCTVVSNCKDTDSNLRSTNSIRVPQVSCEQSVIDSDTSLSFGVGTPSNVISSLIPTHENNPTSTWGTVSDNEQRVTSTGLSIYSPQNSPSRRRMDGAKGMGCLCGQQSLKTGRPMKILAGTSNPQFRAHESRGRRFFRGLHERFRRLLANGI